MTKEFMFQAGFSFIAPNGAIVSKGDFLTAKEKELDGERLGEYLIYAEGEDPILWNASTNDVEKLGG